MQSLSCACVIATLAFSLNGCGQSSSARPAVSAIPDCDVPWSYRDVQAWDALPNGMCGHANDQSPIDIVAADVAEDHHLGNIAFEMPEHDVNVSFLYDLKTWQANTPTGAAGVTFQGKEFRLVQFHFHSPSENTIDGVHGAMESHFVNVATDGQILVVAVLWDLGAESQTLGHLEAIAAPQKAGADGVYDHDHPFHFDADVTIPNPYHFTEGMDQSYYHYAGSLTTPPCTNGTEWVVFHHRATLSAEQLQIFRHDLSDPRCSMAAVHTASYPEGLPHADWNLSLGVNNRPTQPLAGRSVGFHTYADPSIVLAAVPSESILAQQPVDGDRPKTILAVLSCVLVSSVVMAVIFLKTRVRRSQDEQLLPSLVETGYGPFPSSSAI